MQFTFVFESKEGNNLSYLLCFMPCPVWKKGDHELINLHPNYPHFRIGDIKTLLENEKIFINKEVIIVVHDSGHGSKDDLENIIKELTELSIKYKLIEL